MKPVPASWLLVTALSAALAYSALGQAAAPTQARRVVAPAPVPAITIQTNWPPKPQDLVAQGGELALAGSGSTQLVMTVPAGKWLVVTDARCTGGVASFVQLIEDAAGTISVKRGTLDNWSSPSPASSAAGLGASFAPGTEVRFRNVAAGTIADRYELIGYLAQP